MPSTLRLKSWAKINLYLKVKRKRPDGFHEIVTLFERIDLHDVITFRADPTGKIKIRCDHPHVPLGPKNLVYRAAQLLKQRYGISQGADIHIKKNIPVAAGLAGGSSNAATALMGLKRLWKIKISRAELVKTAAAIGSDVAFFLYDTSWAVGTGRGERIRPVGGARKLLHLLVVPRVKLYAADVYGAHKIHLTQNKDDVNILIRCLRNYDINGASSLMANDLETAILQLRPNLLRLKKKLNSLGTQGVMISGSGPAVFALLKDQRQARRLKRLLSRTYAQVFVVRTL
jgi:4-diphosphocytidyl-2-C-methyl-D-erythritol kinase